MSAALELGAAVIFAALVPAQLVGSDNSSIDAFANSQVPSAQSTDMVTVFLRAPHPAALDRAARHRWLGHRARIAEVQALVPTAAEHRTAARALQAHGFTVINESSWSVTASAPATTVAATFGSRVSLGSHPSMARQRAATGELPRVPTDLASVAIAALPTSSGPAAFKPLGTAKTGQDFRNAYTSAARTADHKAPYSGSGSKLTIATLQLDGWNSKDLATYATAHGLNYGASTLSEVPVDQPSVPTTSSHNNDVEVDLDQESILSTDPHAHQRAYFAPNTAAGFADGLSQVLDDVLANKSAYRGGDTSIAALSISWGECEQQTGTSTIQHTVEPILKSLTAAGVTVFSSAGDNGAYDCGTKTESVDYPASSPEVLGVGGTTLTTSSAKENDGTNWSESAWSCRTESGCLTVGGSGGGVSTVFPEPGYQSANLSSTLNGSDARLVPDIAVDANPSTGFTIATSDKTYGPSATFGGTSLASPVSAALFVNMLSAHGVRHGIGDIHSVLYGAASTSGNFRDITGGANGAASGDVAAAGYDEVTGLGAPLWPALAPTILSAASIVTPTANTSTSLPHLKSAHATRRVHVTWSGTNATNATLTIAKLGGHILLQHNTTPTGSTSFTGSWGATYRVTVTEKNTGAIATANRIITLPADDTTFAFTSHWNRHTSSTAIGGTYMTTRKHGATAHVKLTGRRYVVVVPVRPTFGKVAVAVDGTRVKTINLHAATAGFRSVHVWGGPRATIKGRTIRLRLVGASTIGVDAVYAYR